MPDDPFAVASRTWLSCSVTSGCRACQVTTSHKNGAAGRFGGMRPSAALRPMRRVSIKDLHHRRTGESVAADSARGSACPACPVSERRQRFVEFIKAGRPARLASCALSLEVLRSPAAADSCFREQVIAGGTQVITLSSRQPHLRRIANPEDPADAPVRPPGSGDGTSFIWLIRSLPGQRDEQSG